MKNKEIKELLKKIEKYKIDKKYNEIIELYKIILTTYPNNITYLKGLGEIYELIEDNKQAIIYYEKILTIEKHNIGIIGPLLNQIGVCYNKAGDYLNAIEYFKKIIKIKNDIPDVYNNLAVCYVKLKTYKPAETVLKLSYNLNPNLEGTIINISNLYYYMKDYDKSIEMYNRIPNLQHNISQLYNLSFPTLGKKQFKKGFELYENRLKNNNINPITNEQERVEIPMIPMWNGEPCNNLLIIYEQGIGDNFQFFRFMIELSEKYPEMTITYFCKNIVAGVFKEYPRINIALNLNINIYNYKIYIMSLPYYLKLEDINPNQENYIKTNEEKNMLWKNEFSSFKKPKIGFAINGLLSMAFIDKFIELNEVRCLFDLDIELICIGKLDEMQKQPSFEEIKSKVHFYDIDKDEPFQDTIAIIQNIDLLITVDTYLAHLAGIMNINTWLLLGYGSEWRWGNTDETYWYNSVTLVRLKENVDFKHIMPIVKRKLDQHLTNN